MRIRPRSPYEGLTSPEGSPPLDPLIARDFSLLRTHIRAAYCNRLRVDTRFSLLKYCSRSEPSLNCGSPTLRFGEVLDFSLSFCLLHPAAWSAAFQVMFKNNAESRSLSCCVMCSARIFKAACLLFGFSCSFHFTNAVSPVVSSFRCLDCPAAPAHGSDCRTPIASIRSSIRSRSTSQNFSAERRSRSGASTSAASSRSLGWRCDGRERLFDFRIICAFYTSIWAHRVLRN